MTGASGSPYARSVLNGLLDAGEPVDLIVSRAARLTLLDETGLGMRDNHWPEDLQTWLGRTVDDDRTLDDNPTADGRPADDLRYWTANDFAAGPSSGSYPAAGMIVVPASAAAVAGIALGLSKDLLQRAASVMLKERRPLIVVPREAPYTGELLRQMLALHDEGAVIVPASPGFYAGSDSVQRLVDFVAAKVLDLAGVNHDLVTRWTGELGAARQVGAAAHADAAGQVGGASHVHGPRTEGQR